MEGNLEDEVAVVEVEPPKREVLSGHDLPLVADYFEDMSNHVSVYATAQNRDSSQDHRK